jgi:hypothetical protein
MTLSTGKWNKLNNGEICCDHSSLMEGCPKKQTIGLPSVVDRDNAADILPHLQESRHGHVEVRSRDIAPSTVIAGFREVGWTEVGGSDGDGFIGRQAPLAPVALELEASSATDSVVEQDGAQGCCVGAVSFSVQIPISTRTTCRITETQM